MCGIPINKELLVCLRVGIDVHFALFTKHCHVGTLLVQVIVYVTANDTETTAFGARVYLILARVLML